jgi:hypothetical protein
MSREFRDMRRRFVGEVQAAISTNEGPIPITEFVQFFDLFRTAYVAALECLESTGVAGDADLKETAIQLAQMTRDRWSNLDRTEQRRLTTRPLSLEPSILRIHRDNPIELVLLGVVVVLAAAVVLSGGTFEISLKSLKVKLPPLGTGIKKLREAFK